MAVRVVISDGIINSVLASEHPGRRVGMAGQAVLVDNVPGE